MHAALGDVFVQGKSMTKENKNEKSGQFSAPSAAFRVELQWRVDRSRCCGNTRGIRRVGKTVVRLAIVAKAISSHRAVFAAL